MSRVYLAVGGEIAVVSQSFIGRPGRTASS